MDPIVADQEECSQNIVAEIMGFEPPFTQTSVASTSKKYGPNVVQSQLKAVRRVRKTKCTPPTASTSANVNGDSSSRSIHEISSDEEFFKQPAPKAAKSSSVLKQSKKIVEKSDSTIWEEKCVNLSNFLAESRTDHDFLSLYRIITKSETDSGQSLITALLFLIFVELKEQNHWSTLMDEKLMLRWRTETPSLEPYKKLKILWEAIEMCDGTTSV